MPTRSAAATASRPVRCRTASTRPRVTLNAAQIADVVTYLRDRVVGKRAVTPEECAFYYGDQASSFCDEPK